jgi:imidazolonepropionase-like amidohydrolase
MGLFVKHLGLSPMEAILCMTRNSAFTLPNYRDKIGTLTAGKYADLLVVDGAPHKDIETLHDPSNIKVIMQGGETIAPWRPIDKKRTRHGFEKVHLYTRKTLTRM